MSLVKEHFLRVKDWWSMTLESRQWPSKKKVSQLVVVGVLLVGVSLSLRIFHRNIRSMQIASLISPQLTQASLKEIPLNKMEHTIANNSAITILFVAPNGKNYDEIIALLQNHKEQLNRKIYVYPIVYDGKKIEETYHIKQGETTFLFFQNQKEKNRMVYEKLSDPKKEFIDVLNKLPMWNIPHH